MQARGLKRAVQRNRQCGAAEAAGRADATGQDPSATGDGPSEERDAGSVDTGDDNKVRLHQQTADWKAFVEKRWGREASAAILAPGAGYQDCGPTGTIVYIK